MQRLKKQELFTILGHVTGWLLFFTLILAFLSGNRPGSHSVVSIITSGPFFIFSAAYLFLFYLNFFVLVPQFFLVRKYWVYFSVILVLFIAIYVLKPFDRLISMNPLPGMQPRAMNGLPPPPERKMRGPGGNRDINSVIIFITVWSLSTAIPAIRRWRQTEQKALQAERDKVDAELSFLKAQVNPHFLFNTLNNIYSMAVTKNENTAPSIMKLSNIMRYITDEAARDFVPLEDEVNCMNDYIDLQKMRLGDKTNVEVMVTGDITGKKIAPLLLMTFVENVFKYGISSHEPSSINITLKADEYNISFYTRNRIFEAKQHTARTGIGIANARKRLQHLYPHKHLLDIDTGKGEFTVNLVLSV